VAPLPGEPKLPLTYHGGPVMHSNVTYAIYWDPTQNPSGQYDGDWKSLIDRYFKDVGGDSGGLGNVYAIASQYTDSTAGRAAYASNFRGAYTDTTPYPTSGCVDPAPEPERFACLTDTQLRAELTSFIASHALPTGIDRIFFLLTPPGVTVCTDAGGALAGHCSDSSKKDPWAEEALVPSPEEIAERESYERSFCSYHSFIGPVNSPTLYAVQPWTAGNRGMFLPLSEEQGKVSGSDCQDGGAVPKEPDKPTGVDTDGDFDSALPDILINEISVEQIATATDPLLNGWYAPSTQANAGNEVTDQCRNWFAPATGEYNQIIGGHHYYLNDEFNQAALTRDYPGVPCIGGVSLAPSFSAPNAADAGDMVGFDATESDVSLGVAQYLWSFGDGSTTVAGAASVFHAYTYGGSYTVTLTITDTGGNTARFSQPITVTGPPPPSSAVVKTQSPTLAQPLTPAPSVPSIRPPVVTDFVASKSLKKALRHGLAVEYTVNEQVAGEAQVILDGTVAKRLGIHGSAATGLPAGTPRSIVIGTAVLVTTKAGKGTIRLKFSRTVARRLAHTSQVKLTVRLVLRNAERQNPQTMTLLSSVILRH
jgi:hypothetical protein